jgi:hypothetical protein
MRDEDTRLIEQLNRQLLEVNIELARAKHHLDRERERRTAAEIEVAELLAHIAAIERRRQER